MTLEELREVLNEYSEHVSEEFREEVNDWIDSGVYEEKTFKYRSFKLDLDPITEVWMFPDDANRFVELGHRFYSVLGMCQPKAGHGRRLSLMLVQTLLPTSKAE